MNKIRLFFRNLYRAAIVYYDWYRKTDAGLLLNQQKYWRAVEIFKRNSKKTFGGESQYWDLLMMLYTMNPVDKEVFFSEVDESNIEPAEREYLKSTFCCYVEDYENAIVYLEKCLSVVQSYEVMHRIGEICRNAMDLPVEIVKKGLQYFGKCIELCPMDFSSYVGRASIRLFHKELSDPVAVMDDLEKAQKIYLYDPKIYFLKGEIFRQQGECRKAAEEYIKSYQLKFSPGAVALTAAADMYNLSGDKVKARKFIKKAVKKVEPCMFESQIKDLKEQYEIIMSKPCNIR